ncbi:MAG: M20 family metallopeptidase [Candidatus Micrarchaeota archaeon]|nr:M20 family metallopeptidase [Candidatus Micrarchaeota archaeon]
MASESDVIRLTADLVSIKSDGLKDGEKEVAKYIHDYIRDSGFKSELIEFAKNRCNVVAEIGRGEGLMLNGHMDTVPLGDTSKWKYQHGKVVNGRLYGRGASDMKGGIAVILAALRDLKMQRPKRRLLLAFVADEELSLAGSTYLLKNRKKLFNKVRYGIITEPTDLHIDLAQKGAMDIKLSVKGRSAHSSRPQLGRNAIVDMSRAVLAIDSLSRGLKVRDSMLGRGSLSVGRISGGLATNIVPDRCEITFDRRLVPGEDLQGAISQIRRALDPLHIDYRLEVLFGKMPYKLPTSSYIARLVRSATGCGFGISTGYTEAELYNSMAGIDCLIFGPGTKRSIHEPNEYISTASLLKGRRYMAGIMNRWVNR